MPSTFSLIGSTTLTTAQTTVTFGSIPTSFRDLCLIMTTRSTFTGSTNSRYRVYINTTSAGVNYSYSEIEARNGNININNDTAGSFFSGMRDYAPSSGSNQFDTNQLYFGDFQSGFNKTFFNDHAMAQDAVTDTYAHCSACTWTSTSNITSIICVMGNGVNFATGSAFYLFGISTT